MYCPKCGEEICIVPDYEPELLDRIDMTMMEVADSVNEKTQDMGILSSPTTPLPEKTENPPAPATFSKRLKWIFLGLALCVVIVLLTIGIINVAHYFSYDYQYEKAMKEFNVCDYNTSLQTAKHAVGLDKTKDVLLLVADDYYAMANYDAAVATLVELLSQNPNDAAVFDKIVKCYETVGDSKAINNLILSSNNESFVTKYSEYVSVAPYFSLPSGTYTEPDAVSIFVSGEGTLYYSTDGSEPTEESFVYSEPVILPEGQTTIRAVFVNAKGIHSEIVSQDYEVKIKLPDAPVLLTDGGSYSEPALVKVIVPEKGVVHYTKDGSAPTENSPVYTMPVFMPVGNSRLSFVTIADDGMSSAVVNVSYNLTLSGVVTTQIAEMAIPITLSTLGENVLMNTYKVTGAYKNDVGTFYIVDEFQGAERTERMFGVDIVTGSQYRVHPDVENESYSFEKII